MEEVSAAAGTVSSVDSAVPDSVAGISYGEAGQAGSSGQADVSSASAEENNAIVSSNAGPTGEESNVDAAEAAEAANDVAPTASQVMASSSEVKKGPATPSRKLRKEEIKEGINASAAAFSAVDLRKDPSVLLAEYLTKRSESGLFHNWQKRWVMLVGNLIYYFEKEDSVKARGMILLDGASVACVAQKQFKGQECIVIKTKAARVFYFYGSAAQNSTWLAAVRTVAGVTSAAPGSEPKAEGELTSSASSTATATSASSTERSSASTTSIALQGTAGGLDPAAEEMGVTDTVNALMSDLPPEVQLVWVTVLSAATRCKELEVQLASTRSALKEEQARAVLSNENIMAVGASADVQEAFARAKAELEAQAHVRIAESVAEATSAAEARLALEWRATLEKVRAEEGAKRQALEQQAVGDALPAAVAEATASKNAEIAVLRLELDEIKSAAAEAAAARDMAAEASGSVAAAEVTLLRQQLANAASKVELARIESETGKQEAAGLKARLATLEKTLASAEARADSASTDAAQEYVRVVNMEREASKLRAQLSDAQNRASASADSGLDAAVAKASAAAATAEVEKWRAEAASLRTEVTGLREQVTTAAAAASSAGNVTKKELDSTLAKLDAEHTRSGVLKEALADIREEAARTSAALADKEMQVTILTKEVAALQAVTDSAHASAAGMVSTTVLEAAEVEKAAAEAETANAVAQLATERQRSDRLISQLEAQGHAVADAEAAATAAAARVRELESIIETSKSEGAGAGAASEAAQRDASRVIKTLGAVVNLVKEVIGCPDAPAASGTGTVDLFGMRDAVKKALEARDVAVSEKERVAAGFVKVALEKKVAGLEASLAVAAEDKAGLEQELDEMEAAEARLKTDATLWMGNARELEAKLTDAHDELERVKQREREMEMALADAKAKLYNVNKASAAAGLLAGTGKSGASV